MRIALVSPYSWTYRGGVNSHVQALAKELSGRDHHVRVLAPYDPPDRVTNLLHRQEPMRREPPDYLIPLGRTVGFGANGSVANLAPFPGGLTTMKRELKAGAFEVIHVHEPIAPVLGWDASMSKAAPVVGTFHAYSTKPMPNYIGNFLGAKRVLNQLTERVAVSEAAAWTGRRWFGGDYTIIPNGVDLEAAPDYPRPESDELRIVFVGRAEERKGLPILLTAFGALVEHAPAHLTIIGAEEEEVTRYLADPELMHSHRRPREGHRQGALGEPARGRRPLRPVALGRELRHGADRGVCRRHAGHRLGDRRLQRRGHRRRRRSPRPARRPPAPRRGAAERPPRTRAPGPDAGRRPCQRRALRLALRRRQPHRGLRARRRGAGAGDHQGARRPPRRARARQRRTAQARAAPALA